MFNHSNIRIPHSALERLFSGIHFGMDDWGERARPACRFGRRARTIVGQIGLLKGFRRDAENGNRDGRAPHSKPCRVEATRRVVTK
jgi:hypothetical protein